MKPTCLVVAALLSLAGSAAAAPHRLRVFVDAGHGAPGNDGNHGAFCQLEKDHALSVAEALVEALPRLGAFEVKLSRYALESPSYQARIAAAEKWGADVIISLHSDARGFAWPWRPFEGEDTICQRNGLEPGFAVLWNDSSGSPSLVTQRMTLGRAVIEALSAAAFEPYDGRNYGLLYRPDLVPGGWVDIRPTGKDVYFLRASKVPTIIIETHHALDVAEVEAWHDAATVARFSQAVARALSTLHASSE